MQFLYLALFRGRCLASLFAIALIATTTSIAMPFPASSLVPTLYKRSTSNNVLNPLVRSLQWNANHSADPARVIHTPPLKRVLIGGNDSNMELLSLGSQHLNSLNECTTKYQDTEIFRDRCTSSAASIEAILQVLANTLRPMAARYGLKNYNKDDPIETFLKRTIDLVKDLLAYIAKLVKRSPLMGVALYPGILLSE
ncbi:hypothetical protein E1B28_001097 [Marasmius oreades]|uniref:Uncharacterized protein n=1 Tax=Marasmius oreades TaxID=181124 RepID=A0A9P7V2X7_9AGAR|nr:uncharacterized protein E1B28_001097 [Marasmius oreades]KAG7099232.1 hypothetical protein E1B28_001097 [Marasmius oreades]